MRAPGGIRFPALAADYFGHAPTPVEQAALLMRLHGAPAYFHRRGKGRYRPAPPDILAAALAALEKKQRQAEQQQEWVDEMAAGRLPEIAQAAESLLVRPDKIPSSGRRWTQPAPSWARRPTACCWTWAPGRTHWRCTSAASWR